MKNIKVSKINKIELQEGDLYKFIDNKNKNFNEFGEVYFSSIKPKSVKAWKLHKKMTLNIVVPVGKVRFALFDDTEKKMFEVKIGQNDYKLLTIKPNTWYGFQGISNEISLVANLTDMRHDEKEMSRQSDDFFPFDWSVK